MADSLRQGSVKPPDIDRDENDRYENDAEIRLYLGHADSFSPFSVLQIKVELEVNSAGDHKKRRDVLKDRRILHIAGIFDAETARADRAECMADRLEHRHSEDPEKEELRDGDHHIDRIQDKGRVLDLRHELADDRAGALRFHEIEGRSAKQRNNCQHEYKDSHAAHPVGETPPEKTALIQILDSRKDRGSRRRKAGYGLEHRIQIERNITAQRKRQRTDQGHDDPGQRHDGKTVTAIDFGILRLSPCQEKAQKERQPCHEKEEPCSLFPINEAHDSRKKEKDALDPEDPPKNIKNHSVIHRI